MEQREADHHRAEQSSLESGVSNLWPVGRMRPRIATNAAQHKIINLLKTIFFAHQFLLVFVYLMCGQDNSSSSVAQRRQKVEHPWLTERGLTQGCQPRSCPTALLFSQLRRLTTERFHGHAVSAATMQHY